MGTIYGLINHTRKEAIHLDCKYGEASNYANFITWLTFEWNKDNWEWVNDKDSFDFPEEYYKYTESKESYLEEFKDNFWFN